MSHATDPLSHGSDDFRAVLDGLDRNREESGMGALRQAAMLAFGRRANARPPIAVLIQDAMALVAEVLRADLAAVADVTDNGAALTVKAFPSGGCPTPAEPASDQGPLDPAASMAAYALSVGSAVLTGDLAAETRFADRFLSTLGARSAVTIPLHVADRPFGALAVCHRKRGAFTEEDARFAETIAHLLTSSIARVKVEHELARQRAFAEAVLDTVPALVLMLDADGTIVEANAACQRISGFALSELCGRAFWSVLAPPEEAERLQAAFRRSRHGQAAEQFQSGLLTKDGNKRPTAWTLRTNPDPNGGAVSYLLSGTDRTDVAARDSEPSTPLQPVPARGRRGAEKRTSPRRTYRYRQKIAPMVDGLVPPRRKFFEVICRDISEGGISFLLDRRPDFDTLVVALGKPPAETYFTACVVRTAEVDEQGATWYLVGCRFTGRIRT